MTSMDGVLIVGNHLSGSLGTRWVCEELSSRLRSDGWSVTATSSQLNPVGRLGDMICTSIRARQRYQVANVEVYSGTAFFWAEAVCEVLRWLKKPYILTLHGG